MTSESGARSYTPRIFTDSIFKQPAVYRHGFAISPRLSREVCLNFLSSEIRGRRECRVRAAPAVSRAKLQKKRTRAYRFSGDNPPFPAEWVYGVLQSLPA